MTTGAQVLFRVLEEEGVEVVFGVPGGAIMPIYDALIDSPIRHVLTRHEQGAGHAAEGYATATGKVGVCFATSGPGACNLVTTLSDAMMDSVPIVAITGQVARPGIGKQAFQEAPVTAITAPVTKKNWLVMNPDDIAEVVREAFFISRTGRPGPVLIDIPKDVQLAPASWVACVPRNDQIQEGTPEAVEAAIRLIEAARRPVLYAGGGVVKAGAAVELSRLAEAQEIPVVTTLMARGVFPDSHPLALGMPGMHGTYAAIMALQRSDVIIAVGARFDDRVTGRLDGFAPDARVVHVDVDPREIGKNRVADVALCGDAAAVLAQVNAGLAAVPPFDPSQRATWVDVVTSWKRQVPLAYDQAPHGPLKPQYVIERLNALTDSDVTVASGVGQHQMWASQLWRFERPRSWLTSGGAGTMGYAIPAALGAKAADPDRRVIAIDGDGCFQMTCQELATSVAEDLPILVALINNAHLGMVRQWQELFHERRHSQVWLGFESPDYVRLAEAYGCIGLRARTPEEVDGVIRTALSYPSRTVVIDFQVDPTEMCFPMVPAGRSNDEVELGPVMSRLLSEATLPPSTTALAARGRRLPP